jgi:hypothetical protein
MITIKAKHKAFSLLVSKALLLGVTCSATSVVFAAVETLKPIETVNVQEAAPPWAGADTLLEQAKGEIAAAPAREAQPKEQAAAEVETDATTNTDSDADAETAPAPTVVAKVDEEALPSTSSRAAPASASMENWYRNRHEKSAKPTNIGETQAAAQKGDARAQYALALRLRSEEGGNITQSLNWQRQAAMGGYAEAQYGLGLLFANGQYLARDTDRARDWFQRAAAQGHVAARLALLSLGDSAAPQKVAAVAVPEPAPVPVAKPEPLPQVVPVAEPTKLAAREPEKPAEPEIAPAAPSEADPDNVPAASDGMDLTGVDPIVVKQSAEAGNKNAQLMLGTMYEDGLGGLPVDLRDAAHWYEKAAQQGYPKAQYNLGLLYEDGRGVKQDYKKAAYWYEKAAKSGFTEAQNNLGVLFVLGNGVKKDAKRAKVLFSEAAAQGNSNAERNLSMLKAG